MRNANSIFRARFLPTLLLAALLVAGCDDRRPDDRLAQPLGAQMAQGSPSALVQQFLETHFAGRMAFDSTSVAAKRPFLSDGFVAAIDAYFVRKTSANEAPAIDGDLFTDSQEYPTRFAVLSESISNDSASVSIQFSDDQMTKLMSYQLIQRNGAWRVDDVRDNRGSSLRLILH